MRTNLKITKHKKMKESLNYFSEKEKKSLSKLRDSRDKFFMPISKLLMKIGVKANMISYSSLLVLIGFVYFIAIKSPQLALIFLLLHVIIDAFDGPLARIAKQDGDSGALTDIFCDHTGMITIVITLMWAALINPVLSSIYIYFYTILVVFIIIRNKIKRPITLAIRTKYPFYFLYAIYAFFGINLMDVGLLIFTILMTPSIITSYFVIGRFLKN